MASASVHTAQVGQQLAEIEQLMETAESHAAKLRDRLSDGIEEEINDVAQLSEVLDTILRLQLSKDLLERFALGATKPTIDELH